MPKKKVRKGKSPHPTKTPRVDPTLKPSLNEKPVWQVSTLDIDGPWGWKNIDKTRFFGHILPKIRHFESMMWKEIFDRKNHEVDVDRISRDARKRLSDLKLDDFGRLVSLRFSAKERLWGVKVSNILKLIWWDSNHEVYPSELKHT